MNKAISLFLVLLAFAFLFVSCSSEGSVDEAFNCTITFDGNGATAGEMSAQTAGRGVDLRLNANTFERTQHLFTGWNTEQDGSGTAYSDGQKIKAAGNITLYAQWKIVPIILDSEMESWIDGNVYTLNSSITIYNRIAVSGSVTLILNDGYTLSAKQGIFVNEGNSLTIEANGEGSGILEATSDVGEAGIGGNSHNNCGTIIINGGTVNANAKVFGAGIGGGVSGSGGTIIINGGTVNATSLDGAGIGGGQFGSGGTITINEGIVNARSVEYGSGIGGGFLGSGGIITIYLGTVTATGAGGGAGIGGGKQGDGGAVTVNGGTVTASSEYGDGIGKGISGTSDGTLTLGDGVALEVSSNNSDWSDYDGTRKKYMRTK